MDMVRTERVWWIALLLAAALVLHLFMLTGAPGRPAAEVAGHGEHAAAHSPPDMLSMCVVVLSVVAAGLGSALLARRPRSRYRQDGHVDRSGFWFNSSTCRDGPPSPSRVDAGVLLRV